MQNIARVLFISLCLLAGAAEAVTVTINATGTWSAPAGVTSVTVEAWGGGGAGGGATGNPAKGGGGSGGQYARKVVTVTPGNTYSVTVGTGGTGSTGNGGSGGDSIFDANLVVAKGGAAGTGATNGVAGTGSTIGGIGDTVYAGGSGSAGVVTGSCQNGGAGGGGAGSGGAGGSASGNTAGTGTATGGGAGGAGRNSSGNGNAGSTAGGGGGGACAESGTDRTGGAGAGGQVSITYVLPPTVTTSAATSMTTISATLNGSVNDNGSNTSNINFEYGTNTSYGTTLAATPASLSAGTGNTSVSAAISGLSCNTTYHFRLNATNAVGTTNSADASFTTSACVAPTVTTLAATSVNASGATLNGTVSGNGASTTVTFQYGLTTGYTGGTVTATQSPLAAGTGSTAVFADLTGLTCGGTTYHFRVKGVNSAGTSNGGDLTFTTAGCPMVCNPPSNIPAGVAVTCQCDNFARATLQPSTIFNLDWIVSTSDSTGLLPRIVNSGYLRLTDNTGNNAKAATVPGIFPAAGNYISVEFQHYAYHGSNPGADGIAVTLSDYSVSAVPGAYGGSLGYAQETGIHDGFAGGWLGVALDEYGNYQNTNEGRLGGPGFIVQSVGARGSGTGQTGYRWLGGTGTLSPTIDNHASTTPSYGYYYQVVVDARNDPASTSVAVNRDTGSGYSSLINIPNVYAAAISQGFTQSPVPANWQISFTGSTGGSNNIHEIGGLRICASTMVPTSGGAAGSFNAIDEAYGTPPVAVQNYLTSGGAGHIYTKLVGTSFKLDVGALINGQLDTAYAAGGAKTVTVKLVDNSDGVCILDSTKSNYCNSSCTAKTVISGGTQTLTFASADKGQKQSPGFTVYSAYQNLVAIISDGTTTACSTDAFSVRPTSIASVTSFDVPAGTGNGATNTGTSGNPAFKAGSGQFVLSASTTGVAGNPSGYNGTMKMNLQPASPATVAGVVCMPLPSAPAGTCPANMTPGAFPAATPATPSSTATGTTFTYSEVGAFQFPGYTPDAICTVNGSSLTAAQCNLTQRGVYDDTWSAVDSPVTQGDCVLNSYSNVKDASGKYGCNFGLLPNAVVFGRFVPDHFNTVVVQTSGVPMPCPTNTPGLTCPILYNGFVYSAQPFTINVYAQNASGSPTQNYDNTMGLSKQVTLDGWSALGGSTAVSNGALNNGSVPASAFKNGSTVSGTPATPNFTFTTTPTAPTDIYIRATDTDSITSSRGASSIEGGVKVVSGRVNVTNAYGSELLPLVINATLQYWGGASTGYVTSSTDNVNTIAASKISRISCQGKLLTGASCNALGLISSVTLVSTGKYSIKLNAPGSGNTGSEDIIVNSGGWPAWLPSITGRATFGVYGGASEFIYMRESY